MPFGDEDEWFKKDIGFYVFDLPWLHFLIDFTMAALIVALIAAALVHYLYGGIRLQTSRDRLSGAAQAQLSVLLGLFVLAKAVDYYLDRFDLVTQGGPLITGMTYTDRNAVGHPIRWRYSDEAHDALLSKLESDPAWDPREERFIGDAEANQWLAREMRRSWNYETIGV